MSQWSYRSLLVWLSLFCTIVFPLYGASTVYWSESPSTGAKIRCGADSPSIATLVAGSSLETPTALEHFGNYFYWTVTLVPSKLYAANDDGTGVAKLVDYTGSLSGGVINDVYVAGGKLYWTESSYPNHRIMRADLDGKNAVALLEMSFDNFAPPYAIVVTDSSIYWSAYSYPAPGKLYRANLDGTNIVELLSNITVYDLEATGQFLYLLELSRIERTTLDGSELTSLVSTGVGGNQVAAVGGMAVTATDIYWSENSFSSSRVIRRAGLDGSNPTTSQTTSNFIYGPAVFSSGGTLACWIEMVPSADFSSTTFTLKQKNLSDLPPTDIANAVGPNGVELFGGVLYWPDQQASAIRTVHRDGTNLATAAGANNPYDVVVTDKHIFWTQRNNNRILRSNLDGNDAVDFVPGVSLPFAVDVAGGFIYWSESNSGFTTGTVRRAQLDANENLVNSTTMTLISSVIVRDIKVTPANIYITSDSTNFSSPNGKIARTDLNGGNRQDLITGLSVPNGVDVTNTHIYWSDFGTNAIFRADLNGGNVVELYGALSSPRGVAVFETVPVPPQVTIHAPAGPITVRPADRSKAALVSRTITLTIASGSNPFPASGTYQIALSETGNHYTLTSTMGERSTHSGIFLHRPDATRGFDSVLTLHDFLPDRGDAKLALLSNGTYELYADHTAGNQTGSYSLSAVSPVPATFSATATGDAPLEFQWKFGGVTIAGATSSSYTIPDVQPENDGNYSVTVTNGAGHADSSPATLTVIVTTVDFLLTTEAVGPGLVNPGSQFLTGPVTITATVADDEYEFGGWSGDVPAASAMTTEVSLTMDQDRQAIGTFRIKVPTTWVVGHFGAGVNVDLDADSDSDSFTNRQEYELGTNPQSAVSTGTYEIGLSRGWNLISLPLQPVVGADVSTLFSGVSRGQVQWWDQWSKNIRGGGQAVARRGYWIYVANPPVNPVAVAGQAVELSSELRLVSGWNLVGPHREFDHPDSGAIGQTIWHWDATQGRFIVVQPTDKLLPGQAYYIYALIRTRIS